MTLTDTLIELASAERAKIPPHTMAMGKLSLFDWLVCGLGGVDEPVSQKIRDYVASEHASGMCPVFGGSKSSPVAAALANGAISHALDYDDTHFAHIGHLSVGVFPAAMAVAQETDASLNELVEAFVLGAEAAINVGLALGAEHYERGYHQTATAGAFGATVAAARLYNLSSGQLHNALGLCSTRASGLKNQFGTMGKPLNAGYSASNGVECAKLAALGITSADDGLEGIQGFIETHSANSVVNAHHDGFLFDDISFKLHACCHGTHAMIEAIQIVQSKQTIQLDEVTSLEVFVHPKWLRVCDIKSPRSGLEVKFSYIWLAGMTVEDISTADPAIYVDQICGSESLLGFSKKVGVSAVNIPDTAAQVVFKLKDGTEIKAEYDLASGIDTNLLSDKLQAKANAVVGERSAALWAQIQQDGVKTVRSLSVF